jgi:hypothetical protein
MKRGIAIIRNISIVLIMGILITACDKDDDKDFEEDLFGTWETWAASFDTMVDNMTLEQYLLDSLGLTADETQLYIVIFNASLELSYDGTVTFKSDNTYTSTSSQGGQTDSGTWSLTTDRKKLTLTSNMFIPVELDVVRLDSDELEVNQTQNGSYDLNGDNAPEMLVVNMNLKMVKQ